MTADRERGWFQSPDDPPGVTRWYNGTAWTQWTTGAPTGGTHDSQPTALLDKHPEQPVVAPTSPPSPGSAAAEPVRTWSRGWHHRPGDPAGVERWHDGDSWTDSLTGGSSEDRAGIQRLRPSSRSMDSWEERQDRQEWSTDPSRQQLRPDPPRDPYAAFVSRRRYAPTGPRDPRGRGLPELPSVASTVVITLFFGVFGLIPAAINTTQAGNSGRPTNMYWAAFGWTIAAEFVLGVLFILAVVSVH